jgi:hypothetical protein
MLKRDIYTYEKLGVVVLDVGIVATKYETYFYLRFYRSEEPQFSVIKQRKACNRHLSGYRKGIIFVTNQEASGRRDRTLCKQRVSRESGGKKG